MILLADTVANPWTMVVHFCHTLPTDCTMVSSWRLHNLTLLTVFESVEILYRIAAYWLQAHFQRSSFCLFCNWHNNFHKLVFIVCFLTQESDPLFVGSRTFYILGFRFSWQTTSNSESFISFWESILETIFEILSSCLLIFLIIFL